MKPHPLLGKHVSPQATFLLAATASILSLCCEGQSLAQEKPPSAIYVLLIDTSVSMQAKPVGPTARDWPDAKIEEVKRQLAALAGNLPEQSLLVTYRFDNKLVPGPRVRMGTKQATDTVNTYLSGLSANGSLTHFWSSLDTTLAEAKNLAEAHVGTAVRVFAYTDGEDTEQGVKRDPAAILAKYGSLLKGPVKLTCVTLGFELQSGVRQALENANAKVVKALTPAQIVPVDASFRLVPSSALPGQPVALVDESMGLMIGQRFIDWGDGNPYTQSRSPTHAFSRPGEFTVRLAVVSTTGEKSVTSRKIVVALPPPPQAAFGLAPSNIEKGEPVVILDQSQGDIARREWRASDGQTSSKLTPEFRFQRPGQYEIALTVFDSHERKSSTAKRLVVRAPVAPEARFVGPDSVGQFEDASFVDASTGEIGERRWSVNGIDYGSGSILKHRFEKSGEAEVRLKVSGPSGSTENSQRIRVLPPPPPVASFVIASELVYVGDKVTLTDTSRGAVDRVEFLVQGEVNRQVIEGSALQGKRQVSFDVKAIGPLKIRQVVRGPGGESSEERQLVARSRAVAPVADFSADRVSGRGRLDVRFDNHSTGSVCKSIFEFDDGSEPLELVGAVGTQHEFGPGEHRVTLTAIGPAEFEPSRAEMVIRVRQPWPAWLGVVIWSIPPGVLSLGGMFAACVWLNRRAETCSRLRIHGSFCYRSADDAISPSRKILLDSPSTEAEVTLDNGDRIRLRSALTADSGVEYTAELYREERLVASVPLVSYGDERLDEYVIRFEP